MGLVKKIKTPFVNAFVFSWDFGLFLANAVLPDRKEGQVVPKGHAGSGGTWPPYVPPTEGDSRSACPMLNAMANHGILPHDGKGIRFRELTDTIRATFNFAPSFCFFVPHFAADFLDRSYWSGTLDLADLNLHAPNAIEHDASLTRHDVALVPDQSRPDLQLVEDLLNEATGTMPDGTKRLTIPDLSRALSKRRFDARRTNDKYTEDRFHNVFGSSNSSTMLTLFGGSIEDLRPMLTEERFADHWEPRVRAPFGLTMAKFNMTVIPVERGVNVKKIQEEQARAGKSEESKTASAPTAVAATATEMATAPTPAAVSS